MATKTWLRIYDDRISLFRKVNWNYMTSSNFGVEYCTYERHSNGKREKVTYRMWGDNASMAVYKGWSGIDAMSSNNIVLVNAKTRIPKAIAPVLTQENVKRIGVYTTDENGAEAVEQIEKLRDIVRKANPKMVDKVSFRVRFLYLDDISQTIYMLQRTLLDNIES